MSDRCAKYVLNDIKEELSAIEHERWSHWQKYMHSKATRNPDGSLSIPANLVQKWERQMSTKYADLSEQEKDSDREQVEKYIPTIRKAFQDVE